MSDAGGKGASRSSRSTRRFKQLPFLSRKNSEHNSNFSPSDILPQDGHQPYPNRPESDLAYEEEEGTQPVFGAPAGGPKSGERSQSPPSVFSKPGGNHSRGTDRTSPQEFDEPGDYDLKPPPPSASHENVETLADRFYSADHIDTILRDQNSGSRFVQFLKNYKPQHATTLEYYIAAKKAITAVEYANALADQIPASSGEPPHIAATLDESFEAKSKEIVEDLVEEALPSYLTHRLVTLVTDTLVKDITGNGMPLMKDLVPNLAEVYCISDPSLPDNPIVYASEEFYNTTQYGRDYAIGRNCRFLQGPRTAESSIKRLIEAINNGEEVCETILNYRRDGTPFMNLLMIAPLYDNKGGVRYFIGAQVDVSSLLEGGKGLDTFARIISQDRSDSRLAVNSDRDPMSLLGDLGQMLNEPEADFVMHRMRSTSRGGQQSGRSTPTQRKPNNRRFLSMDDNREGRPGSSSRTLWSDPALGKSGRLPGVYQNYLLVRPYPSLRITFTSPTLRIPGLLQSKFLDRIGGPQHLRDGVQDAFQNGQGVTAKVAWLPSSSTNGDRQRNDNDQSKVRWIHCTPLFGSDDRVGVWMVVLVENEEITGLLNRQGQTSGQQQTKGRGQDNGRGHSNGQAPRSNNVANLSQLGPELGPVSPSGTGNEMYADYLKRDSRDGRPNTKESEQTTSTARERREVDDQFRDF